MTKVLQRAAANATALAEVALTNRVAAVNTTATAASTTTYVGFSGLTAPHVVALPLITTVSPGHLIIVSDEDGSCSAANKIGAVGHSGENIDGGSFVNSGLLAQPKGLLILEADGVSTWHVVYATPAPGVTASSPTTWSAAQTFNDGDFILAGATSGTTTIKSAATAGTSAITFPAATDTVAVLGAAQTFSGALTLSATANFTGIFQIGGHTMAFPSSADTLGGLGTAQTWSAANTFASTANFTGTLQVGGHAMAFPSTADTLGGLGTTQTWTAINTYKQVVVLQGQNSNTLAANAASVEFGAGRGSATTGGSIDAGMTTADYAFQYGGGSGGYRHWIKTQHNNATTGDVKNNILIYTNNSTTVGGSSAPGTGNTLTLSLSSGGCLIGAPTGSYKGVDTLNVAGVIYQNGTALPTLAGAQTWSGANTFGTATTTFSSAAAFTGGATFSTATITCSATANFTGAFQVGGNAMTFPGSAASLAALGLAQSFSATQTFSGTLNVSGTFQIAGNAITFPSIADTLASLGTARTWTAKQAFALANSTGFQIGGTSGAIGTFDVNGTTMLRGTNTGTPLSNSASVTFAVGRTNANTLNTGQTDSDICFEFGGGGYRHYLLSRHMNSSSNDNRNRIEFYINNNSNPSTSNTPGTGNILTLGMTAGGCTVGTPTGTYKGVDTLNAVNLYVNGTAVATTSDIRLKENITCSAMDGVALLKQVQVIDFNFRSGTGAARDFGDWRQSGFAAQDLAAICRDWVHVGTDGTRDVCTEDGTVTGTELVDPWFVQEGRMVPMLVKALQQLITRVEMLEAAQR